MLTTKLQNELELLKRHIIVLKKVIDSGPIGIMRLSIDTKIPDHLIRYSLRVLEQHGLVTPSNQGAIATKYGLEIFSDFMKELKNIQDMISEIEIIIKND